ncbi:MAG: helix-turn-helix domain-containing protein [Intestinibacter bartlettii]|uniref:helix-turn-helix domain-containing protein n=1 Tax=Intestinibacter bartlettii TaxID=261299 RepID=UPI0039A2E206
MNLKLERIRRGLNQKQLSKLSGVGVNTIVKLEKGDIDSVMVHNLRKIANALGMTITELFFNDEQ